MSNEEEKCVLHHKKSEEKRIIPGKEYGTYDTFIEKLKDEAFSEDEEITFSIVFGKLSNLLMINAVFFLFNNGQLAIILGFVNSKYENDKSLVTAIGSVNTIMNLALYPMVLGIAALVEILGGQAIGARRANVFGRIIHQARIFGILFILIVGGMLLIFQRQVFAVWKTPAECEALAFRIMAIRTVSLLVELETYLMLRYLQIIGHVISGIILISANGLMLPFYCFLYINVFNWYSEGVGLIYLTYNIVIIFTLWLFIFLFCYNQRILYFSTIDVFKHLTFFFYILAPLYLLSLMDNINAETMSFLANFFNTIFFSAYLNAYSLYNLMGTLNMAVSIATNIIISTTVSKDLTGENTKKTFWYAFYIAGIIGLCVCGLVYFLSDKILDVIMEKGEIYDITRRMLYIAIICNFFEVIISLINSSLKALGKIYITLLIYIIGNVLNYFLINLFAFHTSLKIMGIFFGFMVNDFMLMVVYFCLFLCAVNYKQCADEIRNTLEEHDVKF